MTAAPYRPGGRGATRRYWSQTRRVLGPSARPARGRIVFATLLGVGAMACAIALIATAAIVFIGVISYLIAFISVPAAIFFESYALYFLGSRYEPLRVLLIPEPSPAPYPIIPPHAPPDFMPPHPGPETA